MARKTSIDKSPRRKPEPAKSTAKAKDSKAKEAKAADLKSKKTKPVAIGKSAKQAAAKLVIAIEVKVAGKGKVAAGKSAAESPEKAAPPKKKRKSGVVRLKAFWGVFNPVMKRVAVFEYAERRQADKKAAELTASSKASHFVQLVKEVIRDED